MGATENGAIIEGISAAAAASEEEEKVSVSLYSRFVFAPVEVPEGTSVEDTLGRIKELVGKAYEDLVGVDPEAPTSRVLVRSFPDVPGRSRLPKGTVAAGQDEWRTLLSFPDGDEFPADEADLSASQVAARNGKVVCVIPVNWVDDASAKSG